MFGISTLGHSLFPWQSSVVEGVHVDDLLGFHHDRRLGLVFEPALALEGNPQLLHHGTAEGPLQGKEKDKEGVGFKSRRYRQQRKDATIVGSFILLHP